MPQTFNIDNMNIRLPRAVLITVNIDIDANMNIRLPRFVSETVNIVSGRNMNNLAQAMLGSAWG